VQLYCIYNISYQLAAQNFYLLITAPAYFGISYWPP